MVDVVDIRCARELGYTIKLLAVAELVPEGLELHVSPTLVRRGTPLAEVRGAYNAIRLVGDAVGRVFFHGLGAGQMPTASSVLADLIDTIVGRYAITFRTLNLWPSEGEPPVRLRDPGQVPARFYLRLDVDDRPGVISDITSILGRHQISMSSIIQREADEDGANVRAAGDHDPHRARRKHDRRHENHQPAPGRASEQRADEGEGLGIGDWGLGIGDWKSRFVRENQILH